MSSPEESPAQRAARLRRERREAKIREGGASRLDKITNLSGRKPSQDREAPSPSPSPQPPAAIPSPSPEPRLTSQQAQQTFRPPPPSVEDQDALREQQDVLRALLRQPVPSHQDAGEEEDPTLKLLNSLMGGMPGAVQGANAGAGPGAGGDFPGGLPPGLASSLGLPPWMSSMLGGQQQSEEQKRVVLAFKILHILFSVILAIYLVLLTSSSVAMYGKQPPPPATAQNPFLFFTTGELVLGATRALMKSSGPTGPFLYIQLLKDFIRDGSIVLFLFGLGSWWHQGW
ncbi:uncharacterized protein BDV17DRAFT_217417 [Aspergillus undulatus]|uniref:uncharacterized protein n=1 Tax=Aspergillus undulatus TaxID=1810928 RepID=UPI003CCC9A05